MGKKTGLDIAIGFVENEIKKKEEELRFLHEYIRKLKSVKSGVRDMAKSAGKVIDGKITDKNMDKNRKESI